MSTRSTGPSSSSCPACSGITTGHHALFYYYFYFIWWSPPYSESLQKRYYTTIWQRLRIIVGDAGFEPRTLCPRRLVRCQWVTTSLIHLYLLTVGIKAESEFYIGKPHAHILSTILTIFSLLVSTGSPREVCLGMIDNSSKFSLMQCVTSALIVRMFCWYGNLLLSKSGVD